MRRLPIRVRLTAAFAIATAAVLVLAGWFVHARLRADFDDSIDTTLRSRSAAASALIDTTGSLQGFPLEDAEESFVLIVDDAGVTIEAVGSARSPLRAEEVEGVGADELWSTRTVAGADGAARVLARRLPGQPTRVLVVGQSVVNRDEALRDLVASFALAAPIAILLASLAGYALARIAFRPVEAMRSSAARLSIGGGGERLPVPAVHDEIRRLAVTLNEMIDRNEESFAREQRFVADASHELRTPIATIMIELEAALLDESLTPTARESVRSALDESDSLAQLADDLLVLARSGPDGLDLIPELTPVADVLRAARQRFVDRAAQHGRSIDVAFDTLDDSLDVEVDRVRIRQVLSNLIDNALRHGAGTIRLAGRADGDRVVIEVADDGRGFDPAIAGRAFDRFTRGASARAESGAGLGLAIVDTIVRAHGGATSVLPGSPTTVRITLPRHRNWLAINQPSIDKERP